MHRALFNFSRFTTRKASSWHATSTPTIFTSSELDPALNLDPFMSKSKRLFDELTCYYVSPADLNYTLPTKQVPEFAFIGRSNVGKSSLISALIGHNENLVRISKTPGATRSVNYFAFAEQPPPDHSPSFYLIDLPGYGFAKAGKEEQVKWKKFIHGYFNARDLTTLRRVYLLIDSRHGFKLSDVEMMLILNKAALPYQVVLTKTDISSKVELNGSLNSAFDELMKTGRLTCGLPLVHAVSANNGNGIAELKASMCEIFSHNWSTRTTEDISPDSKQFVESLLKQNPGELQ